MQDNHFKFVVTPEIIGLGIKVSGFLLEGIKIDSYRPEFFSYRQDFLKGLKASCAPNLIEQDPVIRGYRQLHYKTDVNKKLVPSPESLFKYFFKNGDMPAINPLVDVYNCVSLETRLSIGAHDLDQVHGCINLRIASGHEHFIPLGSGTVEKIKTGEYCYLDDSDEVLCRLECRQSDKTKIVTTTRRCFLIVQGNEFTPADLVLKTSRRLSNLIHRFCGGEEKSFFMYP